MLTPPKNSSHKGVFIAAVEITEKMTDAKKYLVSRRRAEFFVYRRRFGFEYFCEDCQAESRFVSLEDAMLLCDLTMREIVRRADARAIHFLESTGGHLVVCQKSLPGKSAVAFENHITKGVQENVEQ